MKTNHANVMTFACLAVLCVAFVGWIGSGDARAESLLQDRAALHIGVVDALAVINQLDELPVRQAEWQGKVDQAQGKLDKLRIDAEKMRADLDELKLSRDQELDLRIKLAELDAQARVKREALEQVLAVEQGRMIAGLYNKVIAEIDRIALQDGYDLVLVDDRTIVPPEEAPAAAVRQAIQTRRIAFASNAIVITDRVAQEMNALFKAEGG